MGVETKDWIELAKLAQASHHSRRETEWKLAFGFWTAIGAFTAAAFTVPGFQWSGLYEWILAAIYAATLLTMVVFWQYPLHSAHATDRDWFVFYTYKAHGCLPAGEKEPVPPGKSARLKWRNWFWLIGQLLL